MVERKRNRRQSKQSGRGPVANRGIMKSILLLAIGMGAGIVLVQFFQGNNELILDEDFGSGIKNMLKSRPKSTKSLGLDQTGDASVDVQVVSDKKFTFWETLPEMEQILPEDLSESDAINVSDKKYVYFLQIASFVSEQDADGLRARLALAGFETFSQRVEVDGAGTRYRVRTPTYDSRRATKNLQQSLQSEGVNPITIRLDAS
ncbi:MAG: SPOR domain-containing protein [Arenicellaceae bacterium]|nr:SPOR domain-containing protein [Arenicellaceae bacterium]